MSGYQAAVLDAKSQAFAGNSDVVKEIRSGLPVLLTEVGIIRGLTNDEDEWFMYLEELFEIEPIAEQAE